MSSTIELDEDLTEKRRVRVQAQSIFSGFIERTAQVGQERNRTPKPARRSLVEFYELVDTAIKNLEDRANTPTSHRITFTEEDIDRETETEVITFKCVFRNPGSFAGGKAHEGSVKNMVPMFREEKDDPEYPGYRVVTTGYFYDNRVRFTCWARTNKRANYRADWFENLMEEYRWFFKAEGVDRVLFEGRGEDITKEVGENKWYGRPFDFFVRTEKIRNMHEKTIEDILIKVSAEAYTRFPRT